MCYLLLIIFVFLPYLGVFLDFVWLIPEQSILAHFKEKVKGLVKP